jgi:hypothetical protein
MPPLRTTTNWSGTMAFESPDVDLHELLAGIRYGKVAP